MHVNLWCVSNRKEEQEKILETHTRLDNSIRYASVPLLPWFILTRYLPLAHTSVRVHVLIILAK